MAQKPRFTVRRPLGGAAFIAACALTACSTKTEVVPEDVYPDSGTPSDGGHGDATSNPYPTTIYYPEFTNDAGGVLIPMQRNSELGTPDPGAYGIHVSASGEANAINGYPFPPDNWTADTYMYDGWQFQIEEYIVNIADITLWDNPYETPSNQADHGAIRAQVKGPFVIDLHKGGPLVGQGGYPEQGLPYAAITKDINGNQLVPATDYGVGFSTAAASYSGYNVNLELSQQADFDFMVQNGYSVLYVGTATWMGNSSSNPYGCTQTNAGAPPDAGLMDAGDDGGQVATYVDGGYDFTQMPPTMRFRLGFSTPTNYVNCQNMTATFGQAQNGEDYVRGIEVSQSQSVPMQTTIHMDHPFWQSFEENTPVHWDQIAAQYVGVEDAEAHVEDMVGVPYWAMTDKNGVPLPWRNCAGSNYTPPGNGQMFFNSCSVPQAAAGADAAAGIRDYYDYMRYDQSTQGHLNSQGMCVVERQYLAPSGGSTCN